MAIKQIPERKHDVPINPSSSFSKPPPPPPPAPSDAAWGTSGNSGKTKTKLMGIGLLVLLILMIISGQVIANWQEESKKSDMTLQDTIIGSWTLYMDNSGVGAYVNISADGSMQLTEGRIGEWMTTEHRLVEEEGAEFVEFYCEDTERWIRFMEIKTDGEQELRLIYLEEE